ncbi:MAG: O-antigen polysaccharide polymerase Wzy [Acidimicrobiia bacterium]|nr:O-antigen polysaccharide polymerase Wzy [Acidimicrobiia bacterium]
MSTSVPAMQTQSPAFERFPVILLILSLAYYFVFYVVSGLAQHSTLFPQPVPGEIQGYYATPIGLATFAVLGAGVAALILGYLSGIRAARIRAARSAETPPPDFSLVKTDILYLLCAFNIFAVAMFYLLEIRPPIVYQLSHSALFFSMAVVRHGQITRSASCLARWIGYGALVFVFLSLAPLRQGTLLFLGVLFLGILEVIYGRRKWLMWGIVFALILSVYPFKRTPMPLEIVKICQPKLNIEPQLARRVFASAFETCRTNADRINFANAGISWARDQVLRRISTVRLLDRVVSETPDQVPFFAGKTLRPLLYVPIPRLIWPDKPSEGIGNQIGHLYRILNPGDMTTSVNLPWIVEFYINFGLVGVVLGLGLSGFILGVLARRGTAGTRSPVLPLLTIGILFPLAYQESNISLMVGNALHGVAGAAAMIAVAWIVGPYCKKSDNRVSAC